VLTRPRWRRLFLWTLLAEYFQARLVKTADLDPTRSYVLAAAPHGKLALQQAPA
jgi:hypothetical protein